MTQHSFAVGLENTAAVGLWEDWPTLPDDVRLDRFRALPRDEANEFFFALAPIEQAKLLSLLDPGERKLWFRLLPPDDAADVIQEAPPEQRDSLLELLDDATRAEVRALLAYAEDEAGGLMNPRFARLRPEMTVDEAVSYLRKQAGTVEALYYAYVLDEGQRLLGAVSLRELFQAPGGKLVREIMHTDLVTVPEDLDQEMVARLYVERDLLAIPVVDREGRMKGIITFDDIADVVREEATEDIQKLGGTEALKVPYLHTSFGYLVRKRAGWLAMLFLGEMLTATAMAYYEEEIARAVVLALFVPLIISSGGNAGSQATTLVIRAMAVGEIRIRDWWRVMRREIGAGLALGSILGTIGLIRVLVWQAAGGVYGEHYLMIGATVALSLVGVVLWGSVVGAMLPFAFRKLGLDPASASAPFVATLVDVTGLIIYFTVARAVLQGTLL
ncbi:MAG: magnesium transporter MgtE [Gemmatimonadales bacterium]|nr:MAG: magnesium transporter MgtE [Gemmatimonadales bacterium]